MATPCTHYPTILKPGTTDNYNIGTFNDNYDEIDGIMYANQQAAAKIFVPPTSSADGESGRVPVPQIADAGKVLYSDGWRALDFSSLSAQQIADLKTALGLS